MTLSIIELINNTREVKIEEDDLIIKVDIEEKDLVNV